MKNLASALKNGLWAILALLTAVSCSKEDSSSGKGQLSITAKSMVSSTSSKASLTGKSLNSDVTITDFRMNLSEFELEMDDDNEEDDTEDSDNEQWNDDGYFDFEDEIELEGPFELDLLAGQVSFISVEIPNGIYEELEFKFDESTDPNSDLFGKSVLIQGTVNGTPFIFWHNFEDEVEVDFEDSQLDIVIQNNTNELILNFDLSLVFDVTSGVDLSQAADGNGDGIIEISPIDQDGNNAIAQSIKNNIKAAIDLLDD
ncbi:MAG: hypothetical protein ACI9AV_001210 [Sediminicola sp.]|jgi:hypothetical protein